MFFESFEVASIEPERLDSLVPHWDALARAVSGPNVFYEGWALLPALRAFSNANTVRLLLVWEDEQRSALLALLPLCIERGFRGLPLERTGLWRHPYCFLCTPLLRRDHPSTLWPRILRWIREEDALPRFTSLYRLGDADAIVAVLVDRESRDTAGVTGHVTGVQRAVLHVRNSTHTAFLRGLRTKKRKEWARHWRRFNELGDVQTMLHDGNTPPTRFDEAIERFLTLEHASWKGEQGTSLLSLPVHARFFRELLGRGQRRGRAAMLEIALDGEPVGMIALLVSACGSVAYTLKIASCARHPQYSLGSQIVLQLSARAYADLSVDMIDSCAAAEHPMIDRLWTARRDIVNLHVANGSPVARLVVPLTDTALSVLRRSGRQPAFGQTDRGDTT